MGLILFFPYLCAKIRAFMSVLQEKILLIRALLDVEDNSLIQKIKQLLFENTAQKKFSAPKVETETLLNIALEPIPEYIEVETLKKQQQYQPEKVQLAFSLWNEEKWAKNETYSALLSSINN